MIRACPERRLSQNRETRSEQAYVLSVYKRLRAIGVPSLWEAPLLGRSVDLVFYRNEELVSVEFKLRNWRRGIEQARDHCLGVDYAYLCLPTRVPGHHILAAASEAGIGILGYREKSSGWPFQVALEAPRSSLTWPAARECLRQMLRTK